MPGPRFPPGEEQFRTPRSTSTSGGGGGGSLSVPTFDPSKFAGAGSNSGPRKLTAHDIAVMKANQAAERAAGLTGPQPLTGRDVATLQGNAAAQLAAGLTGPFTPEAIRSG